MCANHHMGVKETQWVTPAQKQEHPRPPPPEPASLRAQAGCPIRTPGGCQGRVLIFSPDTSWGTLCSGWEGQTSADKAAMLSDLEARIRCFSPQSNPQRTSSRIPPSIWSTEEPPTAGRMEALAPNTRCLCPVACQGPSRQSHKTVTAWSHCTEHAGDGEQGGFCLGRRPRHVQHSPQPLGPAAAAVDGLSAGA